jgi:excisionase family DNA binding protein
VCYTDRTDNCYLERKKILMSTTTLEASAQAANLLTVSEVAATLRVDDTTIRRWVKQGVLEAVVLPHVNARQGYRIKRSTLDALLHQQS